MKKILLTALTLISFNGFAMVLNCGNLKADLLTAEQYEDYNGTAGMILNLQDGPLYIASLVDGTKLLAATYCGGLFSSSPCPQDVYAHGGSKMSSNIQFEFKGEKFLTIKKSLDEMDSSSFSAVIDMGNGQEKVSCKVAL